MTKPERNPKSEIRKGKKAAGSKKMTQIEAFHALQKHLDLDEAKAKAWMDTIRDARR
jgi:hypothetical protein